MPRTEALYTHFERVARLGNLRAFSSSEAPPYPIDDAAVHHAFDGGWVWVLRFGNGLVSAGIAAESHLADQLRLIEGEAAWGRLLARFPSIADQFAGARATRPFVHAPRLAFRASEAAGPGWTMLPSSAAFIDPILSTGFPLTLLGIQRLASILEKSGSSSLEPELAASGARTLFEADSAALLVSALYALRGFRAFAALTLFYFAAASLPEAARRLRRQDTAHAFLRANHPTFGPARAPAAPMSSMLERAECSPRNAYA
jgi:FADH2 O2-dependent halogenase